MDTVRIIAAMTPAEYREARSLFEEYQAFLGMDLGFQGFQTELDGLAGMYGPPRGVLLLAEAGNTFVGCVGLRDLGDGIAEMKRMYLQPAFQGRGIGKGLTVALIEAATCLGYAAIRLDTVTRLERAVTLYRQMGFREIPAYRYNPDPTVLYLEKRLTPAAP